MEQFLNDMNNQRINRMIYKFANNKKYRDSVISESQKGIHNFSDITFSYRGIKLYITRRPYKSTNHVKLDLRQSSVYVIKNLSKNVNLTDAFPVKSWESEFCSVYLHSFSEFAFRFEEYANSFKEVKTEYVSLNSVRCSKMLLPNIKLKVFAANTKLLIMDNTEFLVSGVFVAKSYIKKSIL